MNHLKTNHSCSSHCLPVRMTLAALALLALGSIPVARAGEDNRAPDLPSPLCDRLQLWPGDKVAFHVYALGVQIYRWNGTSWVFVAPAARLFADAKYHGEVALPKESQDALVNLASDEAKRLASNSAPN